MEAGWTIAEAGRALRSGAITSVALVQGCLERIAALDERLQAFVTVTAESALARAARADGELQSGLDRGPLHGIPIALKDLVLTRGVLTSAGSQVLSDFIPQTGAEIVHDLAKANAVLLGKTNTHEFAWGVFTPPTRNPWDLDCIPGGSSGGSAAAVAAGEALGAIGTDTGGSIRIPSACCGVTGFKPTYDLVSRAGVIQLSSSFDHVGPIARTVEDCALLLDEIVAAPHPASYAAQLGQGIDGVRLGILGGPWADEVDDDVWDCFQDAVAVLGHDLPVFARDATAIDQLFDTYATIQSTEACEYHQTMGWFPDRSEHYTPATLNRLEKSAQTTAIDLIRAMRHRQEFLAEWQDAMDLEGVDAYLAPTIPIPAPPVEAVEDPDISPTLRTKLLRLTFPFNVMSMPALSVPCGFTPSGMPVGLQIIARRDQDALVLRLGHVFQQRTSWHQHMPPI